MSIHTPPPERSTSQNQGLCGPKCFSLCFTRYTLPNAPWSAISLALTYFGVKNSSSAYSSSTPCAAADVDHLVGLVERHAERLFANHVLARARDVDRSSLVQRIGRGDGHHLDIAFRSISGNPRRRAGCRNGWPIPGMAGRGRATATTSASSGMI
jgi:hypothetical protein